MNTIQNIAIIGSGNIANFLALQFYSKKFKIRRIISTNAETGRALAERVNAEYSANYKIGGETDLVLLCVPDSRIAECAAGIPDTKALVCHCAGSIEMDVLRKFERHGVFYPLQSFSEKNTPDISRVPFLVEANNTASLELLKEAVNRLASRGLEVNSPDRLYYHLAAVFVNNFTNAMVLAAHDLTDRYSLDYHLLLPLLDQTFEKLKTTSPLKAQTGPAKRRDQVTINKHLDLLKDNDDLRDIYVAISHYIANKFNP